MQARNPWRDFMLHMLAIFFTTLMAQLALAQGGTSGAERARHSGLVAQGRALK
ncbi:MAG: hypothetical protein ACYCSN_00800 [Acidobacteriaceae bacterium]